LDGAPILIQANGTRVPEWQGEGGWAGELPQGVSGKASETIRLVPYAAAKLRITAFPSMNDV
jgi:uncharacterized protein